MIKRSLLINRAAYVSTQHEQLLIQGKTQEEEILEVPLEDFSTVVLDHEQITLSHQALSKMAEAGIACFTVDSRHMPNGIFLPLNAHTLSSMVSRYQLQATVPLHKLLWKQIVRSKIAQQSHILDLLGRSHQRLNELIKEVKSGDPSNVEAQAAILYWKELFKELPEYQRGSGLYPNEYLNYGYAILRGIVARAIVANGLIPLCGIHHQNKYNHYCLADDLMEPYRPYVDYLVYQMIQNQGFEACELSRSNKIQLIQLSTVDVRIRGKLRPLMNAVQMTVHSLVEVYFKNHHHLTLPKGGQEDEA